MPIVVSALSAVVRCDAVEERYPGGMAAFKEDAPNVTFCTDGTLAKVSFLAPGHVGSYIDGLTARGLRWLVENEAKDICVVDQHQGPCSVCSWIKFGKMQKEGGSEEAPISICWMGPGDEVTGDIVTYPSWKPEKLTFISNEALQKMSFEEHVEGGDTLKPGTKDENGRVFVGYGYK